MHPEVKCMSLLTLLYAGTAFIRSFKYSIFIVKKLKRWSKLAGNKFRNSIDKFRTSETLCNEIIVCKNIIETEKVNSLSVHVPTHLRPVNNIQLGYYLAGLIDGDGHFSKKQQLVIAFNSLDTYLAYYLKKQIGYGSVQKVKNKNAVLLVVSAIKGVEKVINLINGKLRSQNKLDQISNNILNHIKFLNTNNTINFTLDKSNNLKNLWLAGFSDADASFQIKLLFRKSINKTEVRLNFQIDQKKKDLLFLIKEFLGGNIGYRKSQDTYYYGSTSFGSARNIIKYFDHYHLLGSKYVNYLKWRKAYIIIQNKDHLKESGLNKILKLKNSMNRLNF